VGNPAEETYCYPNVSLSRFCNVLSISSHSHPAVILSISWLYDANFYHLRVAFALLLRLPQKLSGSATVVIDSTGAHSVAASAATKNVPLPAETVIKRAGGRA